MLIFLIFNELLMRKVIQISTQLLFGQQLIFYI